MWQDLTVVLTSPPPPHSKTDNPEDYGYDNNGTGGEEDYEEYEDPNAAQNQWRGMVLRSRVDPLLGKLFYSKK